MLRPTRALLALCCALAYAATGALPASAQDSPGGYLWAFADRFPFSDERAEAAFAILVDEAAIEQQRELAPDQLTYANESVARLAEQAPEDAPLLLAAAGLAPPTGGPLLLKQARTCRVWAPDAEALAVGKSLSIELARVLRDLGVIASECSPASSPEEADLLVWAAGTAEPLPGLSDGLGPGTADGFLEQAPAGQGAAPAPAPSGHGVLARQGRGGGLVEPWLAVVAAASIAALGGLLATARR
ncbi:MAG: hypothetical protein GEU80_10340 [Dehalococcoidia bacterium]|nr:hypothetical protein [Dehalococcoidia bacterium]